MFKTLKAVKAVVCRYIFAVFYICYFAAHSDSFLTQGKVKRYNKPVYIILFFWKQIVHGLGRLETRFLTKGLSLRASIVGCYNA